MRTNGRGSHSMITLYRTLAATGSTAMNLIAFALIGLALSGNLALAQVPKFSVEMSPADYQTLFTRDIFDDTYLGGPFTSNDTLWPEAQIRFKGHSTRYYAKKSYRSRFATTNRFRGYRQINFNSMYTDKSLMREKLAWDLFADLGALTTTATHAIFSINGASKGLYALIPKVDRYLLELNGRQIAPMFEANDFYAAADLSVQPDSLLKLYWDLEIGTAADYAALHELTAALGTAPPGAFADTVRHYFDTTSILQWFTVNALAMMGDSYNKNYLLYYDTSKPAQRWTIIPWDYDLSWGRSGDLAVPYPASLLNDGFAYTFGPLAGPSNVLKDGYEATPELWDGFTSYLAGVISTVFTETHLWPRIDSLANLIRDAVAADPERWGTMEDFEEHVEALKYYVTARRNFLTKTVINPPSGTYDIATLPFSGEGIPHHFVAFDGRLLGTLWFSGVSGLDSITLTVHPASMPPDVPPPFDQRWIERWIEVTPHPPTAQFTATLRWAYQDVSSTDNEVGSGVGDERLLRAFRHDAGGWSTLEGRVNAFANTVTIDSITDAHTGGGTYFALMLSDTYDATWQATANNYWERWHDVRFTDSLSGFIVGEHGSFLRTTDGGDSWTRDSIGSALHFYSADQVPDSGTIFAVGEAGSFYRSDDTGRSWSRAPVTTTNAIRAVAFRGAMGVAAGDSGTLYHSRDGGATWDSVSSATTNAYLDLEIASSGDFVVVGPGVTIYSDTPILPIPGWSSYLPSGTVTLTQPASCVSISGSRIWVAGDSGLVAFGNLADTSLTERNLPVAVRLRDIVAIDSQRIFVAGDGGVIYYTADAGLNWYRQLTGDTHDLYSIAFTGTGRGFAVGSGGTILRTDLPGTLTLVGPGATSLPSAFRLLQNFPNPFNPSTTIAFDLPADASVTVEIFDVLGRLVASPPGEYREAGRHTLQWTASASASGVYFYRMRASDRSGKPLFNQVKKMVLVR